MKKNKNKNKNKGVDVWGNPFLISEEYHRLVYVHSMKPCVSAYSDGYHNVSIWFDRLGSHYYRYDCTDWEVQTSEYRGLGGEFSLKKEKEERTAVKKLCDIHKSRYEKLVEKTKSIRKKNSWSSLFFISKRYSDMLREHSVSGNINKSEDGNEYVKLYFEHTEGVVLGYNTKDWKIGTTGVKRLDVQRVHTNPDPYDHSTPCSDDIKRAKELCDIHKELYEQSNQHKIYLHNFRRAHTEVA